MRATGAPSFGLTMCMDFVTASSHSRTVPTNVEDAAAKRRLSPYL